MKIKNDIEQTKNKNALAAPRLEPQSIKSLEESKQVKNRIK